MPFDLLIVANCLRCELPDFRDLFSSVPHDDDASFQIAEEEIILIHLLRRQGLLSGRRRAVGETGITFAQGGRFHYCDTQTKAGNGEMRGRKRGSLRVSSEGETGWLSPQTDLIWFCY